MLTVSKYSDYNPPSLLSPCHCGICNHLEIKLGVSACRPRRGLFDNRILRSCGRTHRYARSKQCRRRDQEKFHGLRRLRRVLRGQYYRATVGAEPDERPALSGAVDGFDHLVGYYLFTCPWPYTLANCSCSYCITMLTASILWVLLSLENKRRDKLELNEEERNRLAFKDLTDKENPYFRYVY